MSSLRSASTDFVFKYGSPPVVYLLAILQRFGADCSVGGSLVHMSCPEATIPTNSDFSLSTCAHSGLPNNIMGNVTTTISHLADVRVRTFIEKWNIYLQKFSFHYLKTWFFCRPFF